MIGERMYGMRSMTVGGATGSRISMTGVRTFATSAKTCGTAARTCATRSIDPATATTIHPDHAEDLGRDLIIRLATAVCEITEREKDVGALEWAGSVVRLVQDLEAATVAAGARRRCA